MTEKKVGTEAAEAEFERWAEAMGLEGKLDTTGMDEDDKKSLFEAKRRLLRAIQDGNLDVDDEGRFVFRPAVGDQSEITFSEPDGAALMAMDRAKSGHNVKAMINVMAAMTGEADVRFSRMKGRDFAVCQAIFALFLG